MEYVERGSLRLAQLFDHAIAFATAAVHGDARGLVDGEDRVVLVNDGELAAGCRGALAAIGDAHRRDAHLVAERQAGVGARPALVDAHLA